MFDAQLLIRGSSNTEIYSPWFPRGADNAKISVEVIARKGSTAFKVEVFTRANDGTGTPATPLGTITETGTAIASAELSGFNEIVRYKFTVQGASGDWVLFRMLDPVWYDAADAS